MTRVNNSFSLPPVRVAGLPAIGRKIAWFKHLQHQKSEGLSAGQIRAILALREEKLEEIGAVLKVDPKRISEAIDRKRPNEHIRRKLCVYLNLSYEKLWGEAPKATDCEVSGSTQGQAAA